MLKRVLKRSTSLLLAIIMLVSLFPAMTLSVAAADGQLTGLSDATIGLSYTDKTGKEGKIVWTADLTSISGAISGNAKAGCSSASANNSTLTITNNKTKTATLSFKVSALTLNKGSVTINGTGVTVKDTAKRTYELNAGASVIIAVTSQEGAGTTTVKLSEIELLTSNERAITFLPAVGNGSYTVTTDAGAEKITAQKEITAKGGFPVKATPAAGMAFLYWLDQNGEKVSALPSLTLDPEDAVTQVYPVFVKQDSPAFYIKNKFYYDANGKDALTNAIDAAKSGDVIVTYRDGTVSGRYTIPAGVTLLVPFDAAGTCYTDTPATTGAAYSTPSVFRKLTLAPGASITVDGAISVSAKHSGTMSGANPSLTGAVSGPYGQIDMSAGSSVTVNSGGNLYTWGYITGTGNITAQSGSTVYELFQFPEWRGGTNASSIAYNGSKVFLFSQYYIQNIEAPLTMMSGAQEKTYTTVVAADEPTSCLIDFIGGQGSLFQITSGSLKKWYDPQADRIHYEVNGGLTIDSINLDVGVSVTSSDYVLPINSNLSIHVLQGAAVTLQNDTVFLPGVELNIAQNGTFTIAENANLYVYDRTEWVGKGYVYNGKDLQAISYTPDEGTKVRSHRTSGDLVNAKINNNGTIDVKGYLYTTASGANITSDGTGVVKLTTKPKNGTLKALTGGKDVATVSITPAQLKNSLAEDVTGVEAYTQTTDAAAGDKFVYREGAWHKSANGADEAEEHWPHDLVEIPAVPHTCAQDGTTAGMKCSVCGKVFVEPEVDPAAHSFTNYITNHDATCEKDGTKTAKCDNCEVTDTITDEGSAKDHDWGAWTDTKDGKSHTRTCKNDPTHVEAVAHVWDSGVETTAPTCTEKGVKTYTCTVCGATKTEAIAAKGHNLTHHAAVAATCAAEGNVEYWSCSVCEKNFAENDKTATVALKTVVTAKNPANHTGGTEVRGVKAATCVEEGYTGDTYCKSCNTKTATGSAIEKLPHKSGEAKQENVINATCTADGSYDEVVYCTECKAELSREQKTSAKLNHDWSDWTTTKTPTCIAEGERKHTCQRTGCNAFETETIAINPDRHNIVTDSAVVATCYRTGLTEGQHCKDCGKVLVAQETVEKLPHVYGEPTWTWTKTDDGYTAAATFTCTNNGCTNTVEDHAKTVNAEVSSAVTAEATCTTVGVRTYTAKVTFEGKEYTCGETKTTDIPMVDHTPGEAKQENVVNATCTVAGSYDEVVYCTVCGEKLSSTPKIIEKLPHTLEQVDAKEATCTENGNIAYWTCKDCTGVFSDAEGKNAIAQKDTVIAALEHDYKAEITAPTCTADGYTTHTCSRCNDSYKDSTTNKLGHSFTHYVSNGDATCKADGTKTAQCERCDATDTVADEGSKLPHTWSVEWSKDGSYHWHVCTECGALDTKTGHSWNDGEVTKAPTCTEKGVKTFTCTDCGQTKTEEISEKGHKPVEIPAVPATCTATGLTAGEKCSVCGTILKEQETTPVELHQLTKVEAKEATCTENGNYEYWTCKDCQGVFSDSEGKNAIKLENTVITAGHKWSDWEETPATCQAPGKRTRTCAGCGEVETETIDQLSHSLRHVPATPAACESEGNIAHYRCDLCGHFFEDEEATVELDTVTIPALEHQWGDWAVTVKPGCETEGEEARTCPVCEKTETRELEALGHSYGEPRWIWLDADEEGTWSSVTAEFDCTRCMDTQTLDAVVVHAYRPATCTGEGADEYIATVTFGVTEDGEPRTYTDVSGYVISPLGHVYDKEQADVWTWTQDENGDWSATATLICTACGDKLTLEGEDVTLTQELTTEPECEEPGERTYTAKVTVGALTYTDEHKQSVEPLGHDLVHHDAKAPACTEIGWDAYDTCSRCDYTTRSADIEALGHAWDEGVITTEPTCTAEGVKTFTCSVCGETKTEPVEKAAHQTVRVDEKEPTCTEDGNYRYWQCRECRGLFSDELGQQPTTLEEKRISATGHRYDPATVEFVWTQNDQGGWTATATIACACGEKLPAVNAQITFEDVAATCEADGTRTFTATATLDGAEYEATRDVTLEKLGHAYVPTWQWAVGNTGATLTLTCSREGCGDRQTVEATVTSATQGNTTTYTAVAEFAGSTYQDEKTVTNTPSGSGGGGGTTGGASGGSTNIGDTDVPLARPFPFDDVGETDWFYNDVKYIYDNDLMSGTGDTSFAPHMNTTRGMIVTILYRVAEGNVTAEEAFDDVNTTTWYSEAVTWGTKNDVIAGYGNGLFGPNDDITREQLVAILWRYSGKPAAKSAALPFSDANQVSDYAREAMQWALEAGIIRGKSETVLDPRGHATRAETAAILSRYLELTKAEK